MILNKVFKVKVDCNIASINLNLKKEQEIEVVTDVVYMNGFPIQTQLQAPILEWINQNENLLIDVTK